VSSARRPQRESTQICHAVWPLIANAEGQTEGSIMGRIILPKHPMPTIPLTKSEVGDLAAYIMSLRDTTEHPKP
jgi:hypothetical protein